MNDATSPVFLVGAERSGTTLLRLMLDHHPEISFQPEFTFVVDRFGADGAAPAVDAYLADIAVDRAFLDLGLPMPEAPVDYADLVRGFLEALRARSGKAVVGATVHYRFDRLLSIWPNARFVHIVRDPRDVARSTIQMGWAGNGYVGAERWLEAETQWASLESKLGSDRAISLRYEDLVADPRAMLARITAFIGVDFHEHMLAYPGDSSYSAPDPLLVAQWRRKMTPAQVQQVEARIGPMLEPRGYRLSGLPALAPTGPRRLLWMAHNRLFKARFRIRRYSWGNVVADVLSRRLHIDAWHRRVQRRLNAIDALYLK